MIKIGNAPVSYGAFEVTVGIDDNAPSADFVLDAVAVAGYDGIDLGPLGYFGLDEDLRHALSSRGLLLAGGYVEVDVSDDVAPARGMAELGRVCDQFDAVTRSAAPADSEPHLRPRPTVALVGTGDWQDLAQWARIQRSIDEVVRYCQGRAYEAVLHNEVGTQIASGDAVVRALRSTGISLCLDTGHLVAAGGNPLEILDEFGDRVTHVHLKDAHFPTGSTPYSDAMVLWEAGDVFCRLGDGDGRVDEVLRSLRSSGYAGWIVVEQDILPKTIAAYERGRTDQIANRAYLRDRGW